jgi:uncharacterized protein DUF4382
LAAVGLAGGLVLALARCGAYSTSSYTPPGSGVLLTEIGDAPVCDVLSFRMLISSMVLFHPNSSFPVAVFPSTPGGAPSVKVNLDSVRDTPTILNLAAVPAGEYDRARITFLFPQVDIYNPSKTPPTSTLPVALTSGTTLITFNPPVAILKNQVTALLMDFDMRRSFQVNSNGQLTGTIKAVISLLPLAASTSGSFGDLDDIVGFARSVNPNPSPGSPFMGSINLQLLSGTGPLVAANFTKSTVMCGLPSTAACELPPVSNLNQLDTDSVVEMDGFVDTKGNLIANSVEVENHEDLTKNIVAFLGIVTSITRDPSGNVLQFTLLNREEEPDVSLFLPLDQNLVVTVDPPTSTLPTIYQYSSRASNFANLPFGPTSLAVGQELIVHGAYTPGSGLTPATVKSDKTDSIPLKVYLKLQTHEGNFASLVAVGQDDKTGAFWLAPCGSIFQNQPILVITNGDTNFLNVVGLNGLTFLPSLLVKGLLFYEPTGTTVNGVTVPPGTLVLLAKQVHQLS